MAGHLDLTNDGQDVGSELCRLRLTGHTHAPYRAGRVRVPNRLPRALATPPAGRARRRSGGRDVDQVLVAPKVFEPRR